uniref:AIG1-type G domain-containing protein n=1 Tax=Monopterus albus TaxID=43700 RepID=A0A3Q3Q7W6_MONAL
MATAACGMNIILIGGSDKTKTALGNFIIQQREFRCSILFEDEDCAHAYGEWRREPLRVVKTPDIFKLPLLSGTKEMMKCMNLCTTEPTVMLLLVKPSEFTEEKRQALMAMMSLFGQDALKYSMVIITHNYGNENPSVDKVIEDCNQRLHRMNFDKKYLANNDLEELMRKIESMLSENGTQESITAREYSTSPLIRGITIKKLLKKLSVLNSYGKETKINSQIKENIRTLDECRSNIKLMKDMIEQDGWEKLN